MTISTHMPPPDMVLARSLSMVFGLVAGLTTSQLPEFAQQYRQRLGGAIDELKAIVAGFDSDSKAAGVTRETGLARLRASNDGLVRARAAQVQETIARAGRLELQQQQMAAAGPFSRVGIVLRDFDPAVTRGTWSAFEPAMPATLEGAGTAVLGFLGGGLLFHAAGTPFRRNRRTSVA